MRKIVPSETARHHNFMKPTWNPNMEPALNSKKIVSDYGDLHHGKHSERRITGSSGVMALAQDDK
jgi:hypothetical protein